MRLIIVFGTLLMIGTLASCQRSGPPATVVKVEDTSAVADPRPDPRPVLEIRNNRELELEPSIKLAVWDLRAFRVQDVTARLLVIRDGKSEVAQEVVCNLDKWPDAKPEAAWHLYYVLQDGELFGAKNKRLPSITFTFDDVVPNRTSKKRFPHFLEGEFRIQHSESRKDNTIEPGKPEIVHFSFFDPTKGATSFSVGRTVESLVEASKGGRLAVAIVVEWKPIGGAS